MLLCTLFSFFFFFNDTATTEIYTLSLHDALPISSRDADGDIRSLQALFHAGGGAGLHQVIEVSAGRSEEHTSELQSQSNLVCRLLLEKKKKKKDKYKRYKYKSDDIIYFISLLSIF